MRISVCLRTQGRIDSSAHRIYGLVAHAEGCNSFAVFVVTLLAVPIHMNHISYLIVGAPLALPNPRYVTTLSLRLGLRQQTGLSYKSRMRILLRRFGDP